MRIRLEFTMADKDISANEFSLPSEEVEIKAELMEAWLNGKKIEFLTPKTMFDVQTILRHYKDIIVPEKDVKISYPEDNEGARCSVDKNEVFISTAHLQEGYVDETIGHMIHELNHLKMSDSERQTWATCYSMLETVLDSIFVPEDKDNPECDYLCLKDIVLSDPAICFESLYSPSCEVEEMKYGNFLRQALRDIAFLLNAVEDVRIDTLCQPNLKRYIDKGDSRIFSQWKEKYDAGEYSQNTLMDICFKLLFHHKGYLKDPFINDNFCDTNYILSSSPSEYTPVVLETFKEAIKKHIEYLWSCVKSGGSFLSLTNPCDLYMGNHSEDGEKILSDIADGDSNIMGRAKSDVGEITFAESAIRDFSNEKGFTDNRGGYAFRQAQEQHSKPKIVAKDVMAVIHSFQRIKVYETTEQLSDSWNEDSASQVDYSVVVYDAL